MSRFSYILFSFASLFIISCQDNKSDVLHKEIMTIHDEIMPKTGEISYLYLAFRKKLETDSSISMAQREELSAQADDLEKAEEEMMVWMNDYIIPQTLRDTKNSEEIIAYLQDQKIVISKIKEHTEASLEKAKKLKKDLSINE
ncbi:MAG: hypothetical protein EBS35_01905 [Bacteroidetes bacterium]|nr:hypothetical protein [Bacteroidota bacterium]